MPENKTKAKPTRDKENFDLTEEEKQEEAKSGQLNSKSISRLLREVDKAIGDKRFKRATLFVGDSKQGKSTIVNHQMGISLVAAENEEGNLDVR